MIVYAFPGVANPDALSTTLRAAFVQVSERYKDTDFTIEERPYNARAALWQQKKTTPETPPETPVYYIYETPSLSPEARQNFAESLAAAIKNDAEGFAPDTRVFGHRRRPDTLVIARKEDPGIPGEGDTGPGIKPADPHP